MNADTSKAYAVHPSQRSADPWPRYDWQALERATKAYALAMRWAWKQPREWPIHRYYTACQVPGKNFCRLAYIPDYASILARSPLYERAPKMPVVLPDPRSSLLQWAHRQLDRLIVWRQGWRQVDHTILTSGKSHPLF